MLAMGTVDVPVCGIEKDFACGGVYMRWSGEGLSQ